MTISVEPLTNAGAFNPGGILGSPLADAKAFEEALTRQSGGAPAERPAPAQRYAFDFSGQPQTRTDAAPEARDPAPLPSQPGSNIWKWLPLGIVGLGARGAEYLGNLPAPLIEGAENFAPDLSLRVYGEGRTGPHGETAGFYKKDADGQERLLPVPVERLKTEVSPGEPLTGLVKFDGAALERAYGGKLSPDARARLGLPAEAQHGYAVETRNQEEADLADSLRAQGKSATDIHNALEELRARRGAEFRQASAVKPEDPFPTTTEPTGPVRGKPFGEPETIRKDAEPEDKRGIRGQNDALNRLTNEGYRVVQQPTETKGANGEWVLTEEMLEKLGLKSNKVPDALIEGRVFDVYTPSKDKTMKGIWDEIDRKVGKDQAHRIVLNLRDSDVSVRELRQLLQENPISKLKEIIMIEKDGNIKRFFPFKE